MAGNDVYLKSVPTDTDSDDVRLTDPTNPVSSVITGTMAATEGADVFASAGSEIFTATLAATEGADIFAASGSEIIAGTLAATEGADVFAAAASQTITATLAATEGADTFEASATVSDNADTHDGGNRKRKPIIDVKPGWEPIYGLKTRKRKQIDNIEIAPLVVPGQPDLVAEHYARMREEEEIILLLAA